MKVLSLFDGISCGQQALKELGYEVDKYVASEIHLPSIKVAHQNFPRTQFVGDVTKYKVTERFDLLLAGSPCQGFSLSGKGEAFNDPRSALFFEFVRILQEARKKNLKIKFLLENVVMKKEHSDVITSILKVEPININASLVSAQNRPRLYWTNIKGIEQPKDLKIFVKDILIPPFIEFLNFGYVNTRYKGNFNNENNIVPTISKWPCLMVSSYNKCFVAISKTKCRKLFSVEQERLQCLPDNYTIGISKAQRSKVLGNGWNIGVIKHILKNLKH